MRICQTSARKIRAAERRVQALRLRLRGLSYRAIGAAVGIAPSMAFKIVAQELHALRPGQQAEADELRQLLLERCAALLLAVWPLATATPPALKAVGCAVAILEREAALLGLDSPTKIAPTN